LNGEIYGDSVNTLTGEVRMAGARRVIGGEIGSENDFYLYSPISKVILISAASALPLQKLAAAVGMMRTRRRNGRPKWR
jgi:hypothetical protein